MCDNACIQQSTKKSQSVEDMQRELQRQLDELFENAEKKLRDINRTYREAMGLAEGSPSPARRGPRSRPPCLCPPAGGTKLEATQSSQSVRSASSRTRQVHSFNPIQSEGLSSHAAAPASATASATATAPKLAGPIHQTANAFTMGERFINNWRRIIQYECEFTKGSSPPDLPRSPCPGCRAIWTPREADSVGGAQPGGDCAAQQGQGDHRQTDPPSGAVRHRRWAPRTPTLPHTGANQEAMRVPCNALEQCAPDCQCGPGTTSYNYDPTSADSFIYDPVDVAMDFAEQWGPGSNQGAGMRAQPSQNYLSSRDQGGSGVARTADNEIIHFTTRKPTSSGHRPRAEAGDSVARRGRGCSSSKCGPVCDCRQRRAAMRSAPSSRSHTPSAGGARVADMPTLSIRNPRMSYDLGDVVVQGTFSRGNTPGEAEIIISVSRKNQSAQGGGPAPSNWDRGADFSNAPPPYQNFDATPTPSYQTYEMTPLSYHSFDPQVAPSDADYFYSYDHRPW